MSQAPRGFIKVARRAFHKEHGDRWWLEPRIFSRWEAWVDLIQHAQYQAYTFQTKHGPVHLERGEFVASLRFLALRWKWSVNRVRAFVEQASSISRITAQRTTQQGTVYLIVNYDTYQGEAATDGTPDHTPTTHPRHTNRYKNKKVKKVKKEKPKQTAPDDAGAPPVATAATADDPPPATPATVVPVAPSPLDKFPKATCDALYDLWLVARGAVNYGTLRKALEPLFPASGPQYTTDELLAGLQAFAEAADAAPPEWSDKWTPRKFAGDARRWVRLGALPLVDDFGIATERGQACKVFGDAA